MEKKLALTEFQALIKNSSKPIIAYFTGSVDEEGKSWCPDCNVSKPHFQDAMKKYSSKADFYSFYIERSLWKDQNNEYRKNPFFKVDCVPTFIYYNDGIEYARLKENNLTIDEIDIILADD